MVIQYFSGNRWNDYHSGGPKHYRKWRVRSDKPSKRTGKIIFWGPYPSFDQALKRLRAIEFFKRRRSFTIVRPHRRRYTYGCYGVRKHVRRFKL